MAWNNPNRRFIVTTVSCTVVGLLLFFSGHFSNGINSSLVDRSAIEQSTIKSVSLTIASPDKPAFVISSNDKEVIDLFSKTIILATKSNGLIKRMDSYFVDATVNLVGGKQYRIDVVVDFNESLIHFFLSTSNSDELFQYGDTKHQWIKFLTRYGFSNGELARFHQK